MTSLRSLSTSLNATVVMQSCNIDPTQKCSSNLSSFFSSHATYASYTSSLYNINKRSLIKRNYTMCHIYECNVFPSLLICCFKSHATRNAPTYYSSGIPQYTCYKALQSCMKMRLVCGSDVLTRLEFDYVGRQQVQTSNQQAGKVQMTTVAAGIGYHKADVGCEL